MTRCAECILNDVSRAFGVSPSRIRDRGRPPIVAYARFAVFHMMRSGGMPYTVIGRIMGGRDHSTVLMGVRRAEELLQNAPQFSERYRLAGCVG